MVSEQFSTLRLKAKQRVFDFALAILLYLREQKANILSQKESNKPNTKMIDTSSEIPQLIAGMNWYKWI
jgi:hypothetical protein